MSTSSESLSTLAGEPQPDDPVRQTFVEMLFALATAQVAINTASLVHIPTDVRQKLPAFAHLFVAFLLIACSWVGWRRSPSPGMHQKITSIFQWGFLSLLLDVLLVALYFIVVQSAEIDPDPPTALAPASAVPEAKGVLYVFIVYALWDLIVDVFSPHCIPKSTSLISVKGFCAVIVSTLASVFCLLLIVVVLSVASTVTDPLGVIALDIGLGAIILLFRSLKPLETPLSRWLRLTDWPAFSKPRQATWPQKVWGCLCFLYVLAVVGWHLISRARC